MEIEYATANATVYIDLLNRVWTKSGFLRQRSSVRDSNNHWDSSTNSPLSYEDHVRLVAEYGLTELWDQTKLLNACLNRFDRNLHACTYRRSVLVAQSDRLAAFKIYDAKRILTRSFLEMTNFKCSCCMKTLTDRSIEQSVLCGGCGLVACKSCCGSINTSSGKQCQSCES